MSLSLSLQSVIRRHVACVINIRRHCISVSVVFRHGALGASCKRVIVTGTNRQYTGGAACECGHSVARRCSIGSSNGGRDVKGWCWFFRLPLQICDAMALICNESIFIGRTNFPFVYED